MANTTSFVLCAVFFTVLLVNALTVNSEPISKYRRCASDNDCHQFEMCTINLVESKCTCRPGYARNVEEHSVKTPGCRPICRNKKDCSGDHVCYKYLCVPPKMNGK